MRKLKLFIIILNTTIAYSQNKLIKKTPCLESYDYVLQNFNKDSAVINTRVIINSYKKSEIKKFDPYPFHEIFFEATCEYYPNFILYRNSRFLLNFTYGTLLLYPNKKLLLEVNTDIQEFRKNLKIGFIRATNLKNLFIKLGINPDRIEIIDYKISHPRARGSKKTCSLNRYINIIYPMPE